MCDQNPCCPIAFGKGPCHSNVALVTAGPRGRSEMSPSRGVQLPPFRFHLVKDEDLSLCCALGVGGLVYTRYAPFQIRRDLQGQKMRGRRWEGFCQRRPGGRIGILPLRGANVVRPGSVQRYGMQMSCSAHRPPTSCTAISSGFLDPRTPKSQTS